MKTEDVIREYALRLVGKPYIWGGNHIMQGFDCSGLVLELLRAGGKWPQGNDNTAQGIHNLLRTKGRPSVIDAPVAGALAFFGPTRASIRHIGYCITEELMVEAGGGDSGTTTVMLAKRAGACVRIRPIKFRSDLVEVLVP